MASVLVVEDDARVQSALRSIFATDGGARYTLAGEADTVTSAVTLARALRPDFLLLDLGLPDGHGTDVLRALRNEARLPMALVLTVFDDDAHIFGALRGGAAGYLLKDDIVDRLLPSLDELQAGGSPMSPSIARRVLQSFASPLPSSTETAAELGPPLTKREREVTELLAHGATYDEIGRALTISTNTVRTFIRSIYEKLHVCSKTEAVREAMRLGLVEKP